MVLQRTRNCTSQPAPDHAGTNGMPTRAHFGAEAEAGLRTAPAIAFSLIELMVAVTLLSMITLALVIVLNQTQRVLRGSTTQVDVLETGRAILDMIESEIQEMRPSEVNAINLAVTIPTSAKLLVQDLPGSAIPRTNVLQDLFFVTYRNRQWRAIGYKVYPSTHGVGALYRMECTWTSEPGRMLTFQNITNATWQFFYQFDPLRFSKIADGVVHFRARPWFDPELAENPLWTNRVTGRVVLATGDGTWIFRSNAIPAALEIELGVLEPDVLARTRVWIESGDPDRPRAYLKDKPAAVHLFKRMVRIPAFDSERYK